MYLVNPDETEHASKLDVDVGFPNWIVLNIGVAVGVAVKVLVGVLVGVLVVLNQLYHYYHQQHILSR